MNGGVERSETAPAARHAALGGRAGKEGPLPGTPPAAEGLERAADGWLEELAK